MLRFNIHIFVLWFVIVAESSLSKKCAVPQEFECDDGTCIEAKYLCDGSKDCPDFSDEVQCDFRLCSAPKWHRCTDNVTCISQNLLCDGSENCPDGDDEGQCPVRERNSGQKEECSKYEFTCTDKSCIPLDMVCDGKTDCRDQSDETVGCVGILAKCKGFLCKNKHCLESEKWICDGEDDCGDESDEIGCANNCKLEDKKFLCNDNATCIALEKVCDHSSDCKDGSDEGDLCNSAGDECASLKCPGNCTVLPIGPVCLCPKGYRFDIAKKICKDIDECSIYGTCSQKCTNTPGSYQCSCVDKYTLRNDGKTCVASSESDALLLYTTQRTVVGVYLRSKHIFQVAGNLSQVIGVSYDGLNVYWTDIKHQSESIVKAREDGSKQQVLLTSGLEAPEDVAVDWLTGNIYFSDNLLKHIAVCTNNGLYCVILVMGDIDHPRGLALYPQNGIMFWSDWGFKPMIGKASMDGQNAEAFLTENIHWPNGVTLDIPSERLYWVDAKLATMDVVNLDGTGRQTILQDILKHPYGIAVFENKIYWSDWGTKSIHYCNKFSGKKHKVLTKDRTIYDIHIYHSALQPKVNHSCLSHNCSHMCLLGANQSYSCKCPDNMILGIDHHTCIKSVKKHILYVGLSNYLLKIEHNAFGGHIVAEKISLAMFIHKMAYNSLSGSIFIADNIQNMIYEVDPVERKTKTLVRKDLGNVTALGFDHLANNLYWTDVQRQTVEVLSLNKNCRAIVYHFGGNDVPIALAVVPDTGKMFIALKSLQHTHIDMQSLNGRGTYHHIIEGKLGNAGIYMSVDADSETIFWADSGNGRIEFTSYEGSFRHILRIKLKEPRFLAILEEDIVWSTRNSRRIYFTHKSNLNSVKSFELEKPDYVIFPDELPLIATRPRYSIDHVCMQANGGCSHVCISDGNFAASCLCPPGYVFKDVTNKICVEVLNCEFQCKSGECLTLAHKCNGNQDCIDGSDEVDCKTKDKHKSCSFDEFACHDGLQCIDQDMRCDENFDCNDKSDEDHCEHYDKTKKCHKYQFPCTNSKCVDMTAICDGINDCGDNSDESSCESKKNATTNSCGKSMFRCANGQCIPKSWLCDAHIDCIDGSDEHEKCETKNCHDGLTKCKMGQCIDKKLLCNGHNDCGDNSDEENCDLDKSKNGSCTDESDMLGHPKKFQCISDSSICLDISAKCNGSSECPRGEDELGCSGCSVLEFACSDKKQCILKEFQCDKQKDCDDGSDEIECAHYNASVHEQYNMQCIDGTFRCKDGSCIDQDRVCDSSSDCPQSEDESETCKTACQKNPCEQRCSKSPHGAICSCNEGFRLKSDKKSCTDVNECIELSPCSQLCENIVGSYRCSCFPGFMLSNDKITCKSIESEKYLLFSTFNEVRMLSENPIAMQVLFSTNDSKITGIDVNVPSGKIYFTIQDSGALYEYNSRNHDLHIMIVGNPEKISVDWITGNVYFANHENNYGIKVCTFNGNAGCSTIIQMSDRDVIKSIEVDGFNRYLFYTVMHYWTLGDPKSYIMRTGLDGKRPEIVVNDGFYVSDLECDPYKKILYYVDMHTKTLKSVDYTGENKQTIIRRDSAITHPMGLSIHENQAFVVNTGAKDAARCRLYGDKACVGLALNVYNAEDIVIYASSRQPNSSNSCWNNKCSMICVRGDRGPQCLCPSGIKVQQNEACPDILNGTKSESNEEKAANQATNNRSNTVLVVCLTTMGLILCGLICFILYRQRYGHEKLNLSMYFRHHLSRRGANRTSTITTDASNEFIPVKMCRTIKSTLSNRLSHLSKRSPAADAAKDETYYSFSKERDHAEKDEDSDCESTRAMENFDDDPRARLVL